MRHAWLLALLVPLTALPARAEPVRTVDHARLLLKDLLPAAPEGAGDVDLGPAPPPGASRLFSKSEIEGELRKRGIDVGKLAVPASVRVVGAARRIAPAELETLVVPVIEKILPPGVTLTRARPTYDVVVPPRAAPRSAEMPRPPRQKGPFRTTATIEMVSDDQVVARVPVPVLLEVSEAAAHPDLARGTRIGLVIDRRGLRILAQGSCLFDANVGDTTSVLVVSTSRVVKAKITSRDEAVLVEGP